MTTSKTRRAGQTNRRDKQNRGSLPRRRPAERNAYQIKELKGKLQGYADEELKRIPVLRPGSRLDEGATYVDLREQPPQEFTAEPDLVALRDNWFVPKSGVERQIWNRLLGAAGR